MDLSIAQPITLKCGLTLPNRLAKAAMAEQFAGKDHLPRSQQCLNAYRAWSQGGWGLVITGNVQIDPNFLGGAGDIAFDSSSAQRQKQLTAWKTWAKACCHSGTKVIVQLNHPGRQTAFVKGIAPSAKPLDFGRSFSAWVVNSFVFSTPREMTLQDVENVVTKFADAARLAAEAGFSGVEIHAAHGYLLTQFLLAESNVRTDEYGGSARARSKIVVDIIHAIRAAVPPGFCIGIKLNSADHHHKSQEAEGNFMEQLRAIADAGIDFIEISGGTLADPIFNTGLEEKNISCGSGSGPKIREAFFIDFADSIRSQLRDVPLMVTGGFRTRLGMEDAIRRGSCDLIGVARPAVLKPMLPRQIILNLNVPDQEAIIKTPGIAPFRLAKVIPIKLVGIGAESVWYTKQIHKLHPVKGSVLVTGCNGGLGNAIVEQVLSRPRLAQEYHGIYTIQPILNVSNVKDLLERRAPSAQHSYNLIPMELESLASVRKAAGFINELVSDGCLAPIRTLILNGGYTGYEEKRAQEITIDGCEMTFKASYLSHFLLILLLLQSMDRESGRIVIVKSWMDGMPATNSVRMCQKNSDENDKRKADFEDAKNTSIETLAKGSRNSAKKHSEASDASHTQGDVANLVMILQELSKRIANDPHLSGLQVLTLDSAAISSNMCRLEATRIIRVLISHVLLPIVTAISLLLRVNGPLRSTHKLGGDVLRASFDPVPIGGHLNGVCLNGSQVSDVGMEPKDRDKTAQLWRDSIKCAQIHDGDTVLADWR